jgi:hypothetical protein
MKEVPRRPMPFLLICFGLLAVSAIFVLVMSKEEEVVVSPGGEQQEETNSAICFVPKISIAFCGNSMLYFNDCPRLMEQMIAQGQAPVTVIQDSCLRGGATLSSLYNHGNGMQKKFATPPATIQLKNLLLHSNTTCLVTEEEEAKEPPNYTDIPAGASHDVGAATVEVLLQSTAWDYVVLNDYTQGPARLPTRKETQKALREKYVPLLLDTNATAILVQTPAYKIPGLKDSDDLGDFISFSNLLAEGVQSYIETLQAAGIPDSRIAPVGEAYRYLYHTNLQLWKRLYSWDHFHPSPHGTWLEACVIYCTIFRTVPPEYNADWWQYSRYMQPPDEEPLPRPTEEEAKELRRIACKIAEVPMEGAKAR